MSTLLQLLANYYTSVIDSERIYNENVARDPSKPGGSPPQRESSPRIEQEMLLLQRQIHQLTSELQMLHRENDNLKGLQKTQKALMESKLNNSKKTIERLKKHLNEPDQKGSASSGTPPPTQLRKREQHLLSPLAGRRLEGVSVGGASSQGGAGRSMGLRQAISSGHHTLFDDDDTANQTADRIDDINFVGSIKNKDKLAEMVLPSDGLSDNEEAGGKPGKQNGKKRRLARKRIQKLSAESEVD